MDDKRELLLKSATQLYSLSVELDEAREKLKMLVDAEASYECEEMKRALNNYTELKVLWDALEQEHLTLRHEILASGAKDSKK